MTGSSTPTVAFMDADIHSCGLDVPALRQAKLIALHSDNDGIEQITAVLQRHRRIEQLHILSSCCGNSLRLGGAQLNLFNLDRYGWHLQQWGSTLAMNAQILLYCCSSSEETAQLPHLLLDRLALLTGVKVDHFKLQTESTRSLQSPQPSPKSSESLIVF